MKGTETMKMRLVKTVVPPCGLTVGKIYEGTVDNGFFDFLDDDGDERKRSASEFEAVSSEKPEVGQWWVNVFGDPPRVHKTGIVLFVGRDSKKRLLWEDCQGHIETDYGIDWSGWHHEPACTGWDWVPEGKTEQKWPQWLIPSRTEVSEVVKKPIAFYRRDGEHSGETFHTDGSSFKWGSWEHPTDVRVCSEREALDRILPKEEFPQWYVSPFWMATAYIKRVDEETAVRVSIEGDEKTEKPWSKHGKECVESGNYTKTTQADAEARVTKKLKLEPAESPDDWVTQDRVTPRTEIDQFRWVGTDCGSPNGEWRIPRYNWRTFKHGQEMPDETRLEVRCRRKDLPVVEPKTTASVTVYEVVYGDRIEAMIYGRFVGDDDVADLRGEWKYVSVVSTKTVEVML